jgi:putative ABC transport system permease protein
MFRTHLRKILRDISARRVRTALVAASVFIGVLGVVTLYSLGDILISTLEDAIDESQLAMVYVYVGPGDVSVETESPDDYIPAVREAVSGLNEIQGMTLLSFYWWPSDQDVTSPPHEGRLFTYSEPLDALPLEPVQLVDGAFPQSGQNEIAVERRFADANGLSVGDTLTIRMLGGAGADSAVQTEQWTIVGTLFQPYQYPITPGTVITVLGEDMIFVTPEDSAAITGYQGFNRFLTRFDTFESAQANMGTLERRVSTETPFIPFLTTLENPDDNSFIAQTRTFGDVFTLLAYIALIVSGFLVFNVINTLVVEQRRQIGVMKSLGADSRDIFMIYTGITLVYGVLGVLPGVLLGIPAGFGLAKALAPQFNVFIDEFQYSVEGIVIGGVMGLLIPIIAALLPILNGMRVTILDAMTDIGIDTTYKRGPLTTLVEWLPLPMNVKQSFRNVLQKKGRLTLTVITLSMAAGAFMGVYAEIVSLNAITDNIFGTFGQHLTVIPTSGQRFAELETLVSTEVDGVRAIERSTWASVQIEGYTPQPVGTSPPILYIYGFDYSNPDMIDFDLREGTAWEDDPARDGVVITGGIADYLGKSAGDTITILARDSSTDFEIIGVTTYPFNAIWFQWYDLARIGGVVEGAPTPNDYFALISADGVSTGAAGIDEAVSQLLERGDGDAFTVGADEVMVTQAFAQNRDVTVGDTLSLGSGDTTQDFTVSGVFTIPESLAQPGQPDEAVALFWQDLAALQGIDLSEGAPNSNAIEVFLEADDPSADDVQDRISEINEVFLANGINANFVNWQENAELISQLIVTGGLVLTIAATLIGLVGAIGLLSTLSMSVFERQKEIGVMRSVGASSATIATQFLVEGLIVGVVAWLIGLPISYVVNQVLVASFGLDGVPGFQYPLEAPVIGLVLTLLIATISSLSPSIQAARKTVSDILRYQ